MGLWSEAAENLLVGTAVQESGLTSLRQYGSGPALGLYQMEPATHDDIYTNYLRFHPKLLSKVRRLMGSEPPELDQLATNLAYATAMARIHYLRVSEPLPDATDLRGLALYWKHYYNTALGAGEVEQFVSNYERIEK